MNGMIPLVCQPVPSVGRRIGISAASVYAWKGWSRERESVVPPKLVKVDDWRVVTKLATLQKRGVARSFSQSSVSNGTLHAEAAFRALKCMPASLKQDLPILMKPG